MKNPRKIYTTNLFKRDLKRLVKRNKDIEKIRFLIRMLRDGTALKDKHRPHKLSGNYFPKMECHIEPDWLLVYEVDDISVNLYRTGTHSDIFK